jgi:hypothetical protein
MALGGWEAVAEAPNWLPGHVGLVAFCYVFRFLTLGTGLATTTGNAFTVIVQFAAFQISGIPDWVNFVLFLVVPFPLIVHVAAMAFSNTATTIVTLIGAAIGALVSFFT